MKTKEPLERDIQSAVCEYLSMKRYFFWRNNTTPIYDSTRQVFRAMPKYALRGVSDIIVITNGGKAVFLEVKRPKGKQSEDQIEFERLCKKWGAKYHVVTSVDQLSELGL